MMMLLTATFLVLPLLASATPSLYSYELGASNGPENWGSLPYANNECDGNRNSPIAITTKACTTHGDYVFSSETCPAASFVYQLSDHNVQVSFPATCGLYTMKVPGLNTTFHATQFHIHTLSEHTFNGQKFEAELHIVHQDTKNASAYAVLGMVIIPDSPSNHAMFDVFLDGWEATEQVTVASCSSNRRRQLRQVQSTSDVNIYDLVPADSTFYTYSGGLTTPPCSQVVFWNVVSTAIRISVSQYRRLVNLILGYTDPSTCELATVASSAGSTSRPVVPLNGRQVSHICPTTMKKNKKEGVAADTHGY